jgi:hypothetical protein
MNVHAACIPRLIGLVHFVGIGSTEAVCDSGNLSAGRRNVGGVVESWMLQDGAERLRSPNDESWIHASGHTRNGTAR